jgi:FtsZ-binding cell division protein ZapB
MPNPTTVSSEVERVALQSAMERAKAVLADAKQIGFGHEVTISWSDEAPLTLGDLSALLAALRVEPPSDVAEIVGHLRKFNDFKLQRAADTIISLQRQIADLREANEAILAFDDVRDDYVQGAKSASELGEAYSRMTTACEIAKVNPFDVAECDLKTISALIGNEGVSERP